MSADGQESEMLARAVIDASGTYESPNPLGASGLAALGERALARHIHYGIPDAWVPRARSTPAPHASGMP